MTAQPRAQIIMHARRRSEKSLRGSRDVGRLSPWPDRTDRRPSNRHSPLRALLSSEHVSHSRNLAGLRASLHRLRQAQGVSPACELSARGASTRPSLTGLTLPRSRLRNQSRKTTRGTSLLPPSPTPRTTRSRARPTATRSSSRDPSRTSSSPSSVLLHFSLTTEPQSDPMTSPGLPSRIACPLPPQARRRCRRLHAPRDRQGCDRDVHEGLQGRGRNLYHRARDEQPHVPQQERDRRQVSHVSSSRALSRLEGLI